MKEEQGFESLDGTSQRGSPRIICAQRKASASCIASWPANAILHSVATLDLQAGKRFAWARRPDQRCGRSLLPPEAVFGQAWRDARLRS